MVVSFEYGAKFGIGTGFFIDNTQVTETVWKRSLAFARQFGTETRVNNGFRLTVPEGMVVSHVCPNRSNGALCL